MKKRSERGEKKVIDAYAAKCLNNLRKCELSLWRMSFAFVIRHCYRFFRKSLSSPLFIEENFWFSQFPSSSEKIREDRRSKSVWWKKGREKGI